MILPSLLCAYIRCFLLCAQCTPELQDRPVPEASDWKQWGRVLLFTLVPLHQEIRRAMHVRHSIGVRSQRARMALRRLGA